MFCIYLRTNSDLCHLQHKLVGFYNRGEKCLLRGTDWVSMFIFLIVKHDLLSVYQACYCLESVLLIILHFSDFSDSGCKLNA